MFDVAARRPYGGACLSLLSVHFPPSPPTSPIIATISPMPRSASKPRSRPMPARSPSRWRRCAATPMRRSPATTSAPACSCSGRSSRSRPATPPTGCGSRAPSFRSGPPMTASARRCSNAPRPRPMSPISAPATRGEEAEALVILGRSFAERTPVAAGARRAAPVARSARGRGRARPIREDARRSRLPAARLLGRFRQRLAPRVLPVLRGAAGQAHRFLALRQPCRRRTSRRCRSDDKQLCVEGLRHGERYAITLRAGLPSTVKETLAKIRGFLDLCARPQPVRALHQQGLCAAAHRPARHPGGERQHAERRHQGLSHRRPQPARHRGRRRTSSAASTATNCKRLADERGFAVWSGAAQGRKPAQRRGDDGVSRSTRRSATSVRAST